MVLERAVEEWQAQGSLPGWAAVSSAGTLKKTDGRGKSFAGTASPVSWRKTTPHPGGWQRGECPGKMGEKRYGD